MTLTKAVPIRNAAPTPLDGRLADMALVVCNADGSPRDGVLGAGNASILSTTATMHTAIAAAEFVTTKGKADGVAIFTNNGTVNVEHAAAPASNSRIDVVWVKHNDDTTGDGSALPEFGVTAGTAAASPTKPAIPTGALELGTLRVYSGTTSTDGGSNALANTYRMTAARGGVVPVRNATERTAWTNPVVGQIVYQLDTAETWRWTGSAWFLSERPLTAWTPTKSGFNIGNGTLTGYYKKHGLEVVGYIDFVAGTTSAATGTMSFDLPVAPLDTTSHEHIGNGLFRLTNPANNGWPVEVRHAGGTTVTINIPDPEDTVVAVGNNVNASFPTAGSWGSVRPTLRIRFSYLAAA